MMTAGVAGFGIILRNHKGEVLLSTGKRVSQSLPVEHLEAQAILFGLQIAKETCVHYVEVESDNLMVINL